MELSGVDGSPSFEEATHHQFGGQISSCERLCAYGQGLTKQWPGRPIEHPSDGIVFTLYARSLDTFASAILTARMGYGAQACMLNRSLFEDMIDAHWVHSNPDLAVKRYEDHFNHGRMLLSETVKRYPEQFDGAELPRFDEQDRDRLDRIYGPWGSKPWSGVNLHERVNAVEDQWLDEASRRTLHFFHDVAHRENNQVLHASSAHLNSRVQADGETLTFQVGPNTELLDQALFGSFWIFSNTVGLMHDRFEIQVSERLKEEIFSTVEFVTLGEEQLRDVGRNDPCPCGSGHKFKRCHGR